MWIVPRKLHSAAPKVIRIWASIDSFSLLELVSTCDQSYLVTRVQSSLENSCLVPGITVRVQFLPSADRTGVVLCCLADVIRTEIELLDFDLGVESTQVTPRQPHRVSQDCFLAEPCHPRSREPAADSPC